MYTSKRYTVYSIQVYILKKSIRTTVVINSLLLLLLFYVDMILMKYARAHARIVHK